MIMICDGEPMSVKNKSPKVRKYKNDDGYTFYYTRKAIKKRYDIIGFYFDDNGFPQRILRNSIYGSYITTYEKSLKK